MNSYFTDAGLDSRVEVRGNIGGTDLVVKIAGQTWVIELKVCHTKTGDAGLAAEAMKQIKDTNDGGAYKNPVLLALVVNSGSGKILAWEREGGLASKSPEPMISAEPEQSAEPKNSAEPARLEKPASPPKEDDDEEDSPGPRPR